MSCVLYGQGNSSEDMLRYCILPTAVQVVTGGDKRRHGGAGRLGTPARNPCSPFCSSSNGNKMMSTCWIMSLVYNHWEQSSPRIVSKRTPVLNRNKMNMLCENLLSLCEIPVEPFSLSRDAVTGKYGDVPRGDGLSHHGRGATSFAVSGSHKRW